ncbi:MAG: hypothetical protein SGJ10_11265 [Bacteroidota bacterium]|nr:hypothetical protein [Bacteroidota bacterium]
MSKQIRKDLCIDVGLLYSSRAEYLSNLAFSSSLNLLTGYDTTFTYTLKYQFVEVPLKLKCFILQKEKLSMYIMIGIFTNYY